MGWSGMNGPFFLLVWNGSHLPLQRAIHTTVNVDGGMSDGFPKICNTAVNVDCCISEGLGRCQHIKACDSSQWAVVTTAVVVNT